MEMIDSFQTLLIAFFIFFQIEAYDNLIVSKRAELEDVVQVIHFDNYSNNSAYLGMRKPN